MSHDVFISFSFADQPLAEKIANTLTSQHEISCWICSRDLDGGDHYKELIPDAIDSASVVVFIQSANAFDSREIPKEIHMAFEEEKTIIPFRLDQAKPKGALRYDLSGVEFIDGTLPTFDERVSDLAKSICKALGRTKPIQRDTFALASSNIACSEIFYGRSKILSDIDTAFADRNTVFLRGIGGIGKSEIAKHYLRRHQSDYSTAVFARYEGDLAALIADDSVFSISGLARKTKPDNTLQTNEEYAEEKLRILKQISDSHTLIVLDNFDVSRDPFLKKLTDNAPYRLLVTTRCEPERGKYHVIPVRELDDEALKELVVDFANPDNTMIDRDDPAFPELFHLTNRHTLTLELISKYMDEKCIDDISEMTALLREQSLQVLSDSELSDGFALIRNLFHMTSLSKQEKQFLRCLTFMPPAGISLKLFREWIGDAFSARSRLAGLSLIRLDSLSKTISLHPVIREVVLADLAPDYSNCRDFLDKCAMVGEEYIPQMWALEYEQKQIRLDCYRHILRCIPRVSEDTYQLFVNMSTMYNYIGEYTETIQLHQQIHEFACYHFGPSSDEAMLVLNKMGWKSSNCHFIDRALEYYRDVVEHFLAHPNYTSREAHSTIQTYANLFTDRYADTHADADLNKATYYLNTFVAYGEEMLRRSGDWPDQDRYYLEYQQKCVCRSFLRVFLERGDLRAAEDALAQYRQTIETYQNYPGITAGADMASWYRYLSKVRCVAGSYVEALSALDCAYSSYQKYFSSKDMHMLDIWEMSAHCYLKTGNPVKAAESLQKAIDLAEKTYTEDHPVLIRYRNLQLSLQN